MAVAGPGMFAARTADQQVVAAPGLGQQRQQVAGGRQVRQQVFVQLATQELGGLVEYPAVAGAAAHGGDDAGERTVQVAQPVGQGGAFGIAGYRTGQGDDGIAMLPGQ